MVFNGCCLGRKKKEEAAGDQALERMLASEPQLPKFRLAKFPVFKRFWQKPGHPANALDLAKAVFEYAEELYVKKPNRKTGEFGLVPKSVFKETKLYLGNDLAATLGVENPEEKKFTRNRLKNRLVCTYIF